MSFAGAGTADQNLRCCLGNKPTTGEIDQGAVDRRTVELEVLEVLGERQLGDRQPVLDRAGLLFVDFGVEQIATSRTPSPSDVSAAVPRCAEARAGA